MLLTLAYVMWLPVSLGQVLYPVIALGATAAGWRLVADRLVVPVRWVIVLALVLSAASIGAFTGWTAGNPGVAAQIALWGGAPVVWGVWAAGLTPVLLTRAVKVAVVGTSITSAMIVLYVAQSQGLAPGSLPEPILDLQGSGFDVTDSGSAIRWLGLSTLVIAGPLCTAAFLLGEHEYLPGRAWTGSAAVLSLLASLVAGRRAIVVVMILTPILTLVVRRWLDPGRLPLRVHPAFAMALPFAFMTALLGSDSAPARRVVDVLLDTANTYFGVGPGSGSTKALDDAVRTTQAERLLSGWLEQPLLGHGLGATLPGYSRSVERPWTFELQYHMLVFNLGILGLLLALVAAVIGMQEVRRTAVEYPSAVPVLTATTVAAIALLVANASNPYLQAVGHWWGLALWAGAAIAVRRAGISARAPSDQELTPPQRRRVVSAQA